VRDAPEHGVASEELVGPSRAVDAGLSEPLHVLDQHALAELHPGAAERVELTHGLVQLPQLVHVRLFFRALGRRRTAVRVRAIVGAREIRGFGSRGHLAQARLERDERLGRPADADHEPSRLPQGKGDQPEGAEPGQERAG
jgi:hypothetical protein